jgi:DNA-binding NarL/FixJ family response regulator
MAPTAVATRRAADRGSTPPPPGHGAAGLRVLVHAEDPVTLAGVAALLGGSADIAIVPDDPDVVLAVTGMLTAEAAAALGRLCAARGARAARMVLVADEVDLPGLVDALYLGVVVVLLREQATAERIASCLRLAGRGGAHIPPPLLNGLLEQLRLLRANVLIPAGLSMAGLSSRELAVVRLTAEGLDTAQIAQRLCFSEGTIKAVIQALMRRYGLRNRTHMVAHLLRLGVI